MTLGSVVRNARALAVLFTCTSQIYAHDGRPPTLQCSPALVGAGGTVVLTMSTPHPAELAVRHPDGTFFFLVYDRDEGLPVGWTPLYSKESFREIREIRLRTRDAKGTPWVGDRKVNELIFTQAGTYEFILTDVLETDAGYPTYRCRVRYKPAAK
jgi:hypothetical protein